MEGNKELIARLKEEYRELCQQLDHCFGRYELNRLIQIENELKELDNAKDS